MVSLYPREAPKRLPLLSNFPLEIAGTRLEKIDDERRRRDEEDFVRTISAFSRRNAESREKNRRRSRKVRDTPRKSKDELE